jgi:hypothetical protein
MVHFLEALEGSPELCRHHLDMFGDIAVFACVRMRRFEDHDIASIQSPPTLLSQRREGPLLQQLQAMTLTVTESIVPILAPRKVAVPLRLHERLHRSTGIVLLGVSSAVPAHRTRLRTALESAGPFGAVLRTQRAEELALLPLPGMALAKSPVDGDLVAAYEIALAPCSASDAQWLQRSL